MEGGAMRNFIMIISTAILLLGVFGCVAVVRGRRTVRNAAKDRRLGTALRAAIQNGVLAGNERGHAVVEAALFMPWLAFLFIGAVDFGFYGYALINTQNAARVAVMQTSAKSTSAGS